MYERTPFESKLKVNSTNSQQSNVETKLATQALNSEDSLNIPQSNKKRYSGQAKVDVCRQLVRDWQALADYLEIEIYERATFEKGRESQYIWEWLELRDKLHKLEEALIAIGREDLIQRLNK